MAKPKLSKEKEIEEAYEEAVEAITPEAPAVNTELEQLLAIHKSLTERGIKDIGQLEVLISRLQ